MWRAGNYRIYSCHDSRREHIAVYSKVLLWRGLPLAVAVLAAVAGAKSVWTALCGERERVIDGDTLVVEVPVWLAWR